MAAATAVAAAGIGAAAAFAGSTPASAITNSAMAGQAASASSVGHSAATTVDAVIALGSDTNATPTKPQLSGLHLGLPDDPATHAAASAAAAATTHGGGSKTAPAAGKHAAASPAKPTPAKPVSPRRPQAQLAVAKPAREKPASGKPQQRYLIYDSVTPTSIPAHQQVATYANGSYAASASSIAGRGHVLWIDTNGSDPKANVLDVEPGDATPAGAAVWVNARLGGDHSATAIVYTMLSDWQQVKAHVGGLPGWMQSHVRYWIADPTGVPHVVPGSSATQWYWGNNYDITTANPGFQG